MKRLIFLFGTLIAALQAPVQADYADETTATTIWVDEENMNDKGGIHITFDGDWMGKAKFNKKHYKHEHFYYNEQHVQGLAVLCYEPCYKEGLAASVTYSHTEFNWKQNPAFRQKSFDTVSVGIAGFTERAEDWLWKAQVQMNADIRHFNFSDYITWDLFLWGRYNYCSSYLCRPIGLNVGFLTFTGMKIDHVIPIVGIDYVIAPQWKLNAVFPTNVSIEYAPYKDWTFELAGRGFFSRHRVGKNEPYSRGLLEYKNVGIELGALYHPCCQDIPLLKTLELDLHIGYAFGSKVKLSHKNYNHSRRIPFDGSGYLGGTLALTF